MLQAAGHQVPGGRLTLDDRLGAARPPSRGARGGVELVLGAGRLERGTTITELVPSPAALADLLARMVQRPWPTTEQDRLSYFHELGLQDADESGQGTVEEQAPKMVFHDFTVPLMIGVGGLCIAFRGEVLGLSLSCYSQPGSGHPEAPEAYDLLHAQLSATLGAPVEEWGSSAEPACLWQAGDLHLDMYCFQRGSSGLLVGPSHSERSAASDAAAEARREPHTP